MQQNFNKSQDIESRFLSLPRFNGQYLDESQQKSFRDMYSQLLETGSDEEKRRLTKMESERNTETYFKALQRMYFTKFKSSEEKPVILTYSKRLIEKAISKYFEMKEDEMKKERILQFKKGCILGNSPIKYLVFKCQINVFDKIKEFVHEISGALDFLGLEISGSFIPRGFKLSDINPDIKFENIKSAYAYLNDTQKEDSCVKAFVAMCTTSEQELLDAQEAERERNADASVTTGGRRSRYRRRPTKKYFKSRRHSLSKKKRHMKTKRHMKRHRKTKRHIKRY
jgi:hypothetical protein